MLQSLMEGPAEFYKLTPARPDADPPITAMREIKTDLSEAEKR